MSGLQCFINDRFVAADNAMLPVHDLGLQRGYGIFDFLRVTDHIPLFAEDHLDRFFHSAQEMRLPVGQTKAALKEIIFQLLKKNNLPDAGIRMLLSGGASPDGYQIISPNLVIMEQPLAPPPATIPAGIRLVTYPHQRQMPHIKTTDYLMAIWLQPFIKKQAADDVLYHKDGIISECPRSNFFIITKDDRILTPAKNILEGITRKQIVYVAARNGIAVQEKEVTLEDIRQAKQAFISSSTKRIIPVAQVDDKVFGSAENDGLLSRLFGLLLQNEKNSQSSYL